MRRGIARWSTASALIGVLLSVVPAAGAGAATVDASAGAPKGLRDVVIRRTTHGIPHIRASGWRELGYGYGYAFAQDNLCVMAETYVTVRGERSRYFGPDGSYLQRGNGASANNLNSDFFFQRIIDAGTIEALLAKPVPDGPKPAIRQGVRGYVEGYNRFLAETDIENYSDPNCRGAEWVKPITEMDAYRRFYQLAPFPRCR